MKILIDMQCAQSLTSEYRGVGIYAKNIVYEFAKIAVFNGDEIYIALNGRFVDACEEIIQEFSKVIPRNNIKTWSWYLPIPAAIGASINYYLPSIYFHEWFLQQFNCDVIWSPNFQEGLIEEGMVTSIGQHLGHNEMIVCTLHDLTPLMIDCCKPSPDVARWYNQMLKYATQCNSIFTDSNYSKSTIIKMLHYDSKKILVAYPAVKPNLISKQLIKKNYITYIGSFAPYKNVEKLIIAYSELNNEIKSKYKLLLAGKDIQNYREYYLSLLKKYKIDDCRVVENLSEKEKFEILGVSKIFVFPSLHEGFGIPPLEAISVGTVALVSETSTLPEVVGTKEATFDPNSASSLKKLIEKCLINQKFYNYLKNEEISYSKKFNWNESASKIYTYLKDVHKLFLKHENLEKNYINILRNHNLKFNDNELRLIAKSIADSSYLQKKHVIYVDLSSVVVEDYVSGIQRVCIALTDNILKQLGKDIVIPIYTERDIDYFVKCDYKKGKYCKRTNVNENDIVQIHCDDVLLFADLNFDSVSGKKEIIKRMRNRGVKAFGIIYDLIPIRHPEFFNSPEFCSAFSENLKVMSRFDCLMCISKAVKKDYEKWIISNKITTSKNLYISSFDLGCNLDGANPSCLKQNEDLNILKQLKNKLTFLVVSTLEPRKMHSQILDAFDILWSQSVDVNLVFVGRNGWQSDELIRRINSHKLLGKNFWWFNSVSDEYLEAIYNHSTCIIVASITEGFGLPIVEAAKHKKNVIARNIDVFKEVGGSGVYYFEGESGKELSDSVKKWIKLYGNNNQPKSSNIKITSWQESAKQVIELIKKNTSI